LAIGIVSAHFFIIGNIFKICMVSACLIELASVLEATKMGGASKTKSFDRASSL
jgi:hypothetical protein